MVIIAALLGIEDKPGGVYDNVPKWWSQAVMWAVGVKVRVHGMENASNGQPHIFASNHVSWFDVYLRKSSSGVAADHVITSTLRRCICPRPHGAKIVRARGPDVANSENY